MMTLNVGRASPQFSDGDNARSIVTCESSIRQDLRVTK